MSSTTYLKDSSFEDFDPNHLNTEKPLWAVYDGYHFRTHSRGRGPAIQSFMSERRAKLYEMVNGSWQERAVMDPDTQPDTCSDCGGPVESTHTANWSRRFQWRRHGGKIVTPLTLLYLCKPCSRLNV